MTKKQKKQLIEAILVIIITIISIYFNNEKEVQSPTTQNRKTEQVINTSDADNLKVHFIDVGQADSILIEQNNEYMLIDKKITKTPINSKKNNLKK